jgi:chromosome segregation ATPase
MRDALRELEGRRQALKDQERDLNRDIYQMAMSYQRKVNEFDTLLSDYSRDSDHLESQISTLQVDLSTEDTFIQLENDRSDVFKEQIQAAKDKVKFF